MSISTFESEVKELKYITDDVIQMRVTAPTDFNFKAGQFVIISVVSGEIKRWKSYSILNEPSKKGVLDFCIKLVPKGFSSEVFKSTKVGEKFDIKGPFGRFIFDEEINVKEHVFIGAGTGIAPFYSMIKEFLHKLPNKKFTLIAGYRYKKNLLYHKDFTDLEKDHSNFKYIPTLTREKDWDGAKGRVQTHIGNELKDKKFYICGLKEMVLKTKQLLLNNNVPKDLIDFERYD